MIGGRTDVQLDRVQAIAFSRVVDTGSMTVSGLTRHLGVFDLSTLLGRLDEQLNLSRAKELA